MRAIDFVPAKGVKVYAEILHIKGSVRGVGYAVDAEEGARDGVNES